MSHLHPTSTKTDPLRIRFEAKVRQGDDNGCWEWAGTHSTAGYAQIKDAQTVFYAHRVAYELFVGPIPEGMHIDHLCRNRGCVRPAHLEPVSQAENNRRSWAARPTTECRRGHQRETFGRQLPDGRWYCARCSQMAAARHQARRADRSHDEMLADREADRP